MTNCCLMCILLRMSKSLKMDRNQQHMISLAPKKIPRRAKSSSLTLRKFFKTKLCWNRKTTLHLYLDLASVIKARNEKKQSGRLVFKIKTATLSASKVLASDNIVLPYGDTLTRFKQRELSTAIKKKFVFSFQNWTAHAG